MTRGERQRKIDTFNYFVDFDTDPLAADLGGQSGLEMVVDRGEKCSASDYEIK